MGARLGMVASATLAAALALGCAHETFVADAKHPEVEYTEGGDLKWRGRFIEPGELPGLLDRAGVGKKSQIDIRVPQGIHSLSGPRQLLFMLRRAGYTRGVLVTEKRAYSKGSVQSAPAPRASGAGQGGKRRIRYK